MSEFINNSENRVSSLFEFSMGMINGKNGTQLIEKYKEALENITPYDMIEMEDQQIRMGVSIIDIKTHVEKVINVIYSYLENYKWEQPTKEHPLYHFMKENEELEKILNQIKKTLKERDFDKMVELTSLLPKYDNHLIRKENILFPYLEKIWKNYTPLNVMWSIHDDIRRAWKELEIQIKKDGKFTPQIHKIIGEIFFLMYGMMFKENLIIFPIAMETVNKKQWMQMQRQSAELGYSFIEAPKEKLSDQPDNKNISNSLTDIFFKVETGELSKLQLELLLNNLPLDITFVDENDEVRFFSRPKDRFFPRSPAIIGRKVQNCHPPESVHIVEKIVAEFKAGNKKEATFWIQMKGKFILIRYYAMFDDEGKYRGILEVGQDITEIKKIEGQKSLLDWD